MQFIRFNIVVLSLAIGGCVGAPNSLLKENNSTSRNEYEDFDIKLRILGGNYASKKQFPHQVLLIAANSAICGGSILSKAYVLTAAHCVKNVEPKNVAVRAGSVIFNSGGVVVHATEIKLHDKNDLALLRLNRTLQFDRNIQSIELSRRIVPSGARVVVSGWGGVANNGPLASQLKFNTLHALSTKECQKLIGSTANKVLCLGHLEDNGACSGDSGGPAMYENRLVGVANFVVKHCGSDFPDGYASISLNYDWIVENSK